MKPSMLELTTVRSWPQLRSRVCCSTIWAIQLPQRLPFLNPLLCARSFKSAHAAHTAHIQSAQSATFCKGRNKGSEMNCLPSSLPATGSRGGQLESQPLGCSVCWKEAINITYFSFRCKFPDTTSLSWNESWVGTYSLNTWGVEYRVRARRDSFAIT